MLDAPSPSPSPSAPEAASRVLAAKQAVLTARQKNADGWVAARPASRLLKELAREIDRVVLSLWPEASLSALGLFAVGGYGRAELAPFSDVDVLVLAPETGTDQLSAEAQEALGCFLTALWDCGLDAGHSVRTLSECMTQASEDITVATALLEARQLAGPSHLAKELSTRWAQTINRKTFAERKLLEMQQRHGRFQDTPYALEPNVKESPGGLRDLQVILWVSKAYGLGQSWADLAKRNLITPEEARQLSLQQNMLHTIRAHLHLCAGRHEDRLVFDLQGQVANRLGCEAAEGRRASEVMMQRYYRAAKIVQQVSALLLANLEPALWALDHEGKPDTLPMGATRPIDEEFQETNGLLDIRDENLFERSPPAILRAFLQMERASTRRGMTARTLRALWNSRDRVDRAFRENAKNKALFLQIFQEPRGIVHALRVMNNLGILGRMLPVFRRIVGQMQHDLFHVYTVDQHILQVIRNLRRLTMAEHAHEFPQLSELMSDFDAPWKLYLAALFHDIAKGRGGDHSELGCAEVRRFAKQFALDAKTSDLLAFLVAEHLTMSTVAQKQDLADPAVIERFAQLVKTRERLTALYILTVADIRGTSPKVWNSWKGRLLARLYGLTLQYLEADSTAAAREAIGHKAQSAKREEAERLLQLASRPLEAAHTFWKELDLAYFLHHEASDLAWHARVLAYSVEGLTPKEPRVFARPVPDDEGLAVLVYTPDMPALFAHITDYFTQRGMPILNARVHTTRSGFALDTFLVDPRPMDVPARELASLVEAELARQLKEGRPLSAPGRGKTSRQSRSFPIPPTISLAPDFDHQHFTLSVTAADQPGLLYSIAYSLASHQIEVQSARITTLGERAEDVFLVKAPALMQERAQVALEADLLHAIQPAA